MAINFYQRACVAFFLVFVLIIFGQLIFAEHVFNIDGYLLTSIEDLSSLKEYAQGITQGKIYDLQPIRDLSYWVDLKMKAITGFKPFVLSNVILWGICGVVALKVFHLIRPIDNWFTAIFLLAFLIHPLFVQSVALVAARKHLLALLFILLALGEVF